MLDDQTRRMIETALAVPDIKRAAMVAEAALARGASDPMLFNLAAWLQEEAGNFGAAHALLHKALLLAPDDPLILVGIGAALRKEGRLQEALHALDSAIRIDPMLAAAWLERGFALDAGASYGAAGDCYRRAAALDPNCAPAFGGAASVAARLGDIAMVSAYADRALALDPADSSAICALATTEIEHGEADRAVRRLRTLLGNDHLAGANRIAALTLLGDALDGQDAASEAYAAYVEAKSGFAALHAHHFASARGRSTHRAFVEKTTAAFIRVDRGKWKPITPAPIEGEAESHAFLIGYPRSGTTLVENILATAPNVEALEERPTLAAADRAFLLNEPRIDTIAALDADAAAPFRQAYWRKVAGCGITAPGKLFVDMDPLKGIKLPLIARLFPRSRIIVMRRDPRDVVWSCFRRNFALSAASYEFTSLERTARHYASVMTLMKECLDTLPVETHALRYVDLVTNFDSVTRDICRFVNIPWSPKLRDFSSTAKRRGVSTASATQIRRGLFNGAGQWRRYRHQLEPVMPLLQPWVERFGFAT